MQKCMKESYFYFSALDLVSLLQHTPLIPPLAKQKELDEIATGGKMSKKMNENTCFGQTRNTKKFMVIFSRYFTHNKSSRFLFDPELEESRYVSAPHEFQEKIIFITNFEQVIGPPVVRGSMSVQRRDSRPLIILPDRSHPTRHDE